MDGFNEYFIPSHTDKGKKYKVAIKNGGYSCECKDNEKGNEETVITAIDLYVNDLKPEVSDLWNADEQFIKAKGKQEYSWNVLDNETRFLLASNQSPTRTI